MYFFRKQKGGRFIMLTKYHNTGLLGGYGNDADYLERLASRMHASGILGFPVDNKKRDEDIDQILLLLIEDLENET
jgi:hypothetical protein